MSGPDIDTALRIALKEYAKFVISRDKRSRGKWNPSDEELDRIIDRLIGAVLQQMEIEIDEWDLEKDLDAG